MELLIGAGNRREKAFGGTDWQQLVTLDLDHTSKPDVVWDLNRIPLPFDPDTFDEIHCVDVLEHLGRQGDWRQWFAMFDEFYRILKPSGTFQCLAPRFDSVWALGDPGHTRIITEQQLFYLHRPAYAQVGSTPMTNYMPYFISDWDLTHREYLEHHLAFILTAIKPARSA